MTHDDERDMPRGPTPVAHGAARRAATTPAGALALLLALPAGAAAQEPYRRPPQEVVDLALAPLPPRTVLCPRGETLLVVEREGLPPVADLARPMLRLAGLRLDPDRAAPHGPRRWSGLRFLRIAGAGREGPREVAVALPEGAAPDAPAWSPDGARVAFACARADRVELWVADAATGAAREVAGGARLLTAGGGAFTWLPDGRLLARFVPAERGAPPARPVVPAGPMTREAGGRVTPARTYQDLLQDAHDEALFEHHLTAQLAVVRVGGAGASGAAPGGAPARVDLGPPALWTQADPSPCGRYLLTGRTVRPFSTLVPWDAFPEVLEVRALAPDVGRPGEVLREVARLPLRDDVPIQGVARGPRGVRWQANQAAGPGGGEPARLVWLEALDEGDPKRAAPHRDRVVTWDAPFAPEGPGAPAELLRLEHRCTGLSWLERPEERAGGEPSGQPAPARALVREYDRDRRWARTWLVELAPGPGAAKLAGAPRKVWDRSVRDRYGDPGSPLTRTDARGQDLVRVDDGALWLTGAGATPEGDRPFLDRLDLASLEATRLWRCEGEVHEEVLDVLPPLPAGTAAPGGVAPGAPPAVRLLVRHEAPAAPPNLFVQTLGGPARAQVTAWPDPQPALRGVERRLLTYARADGVPLSGTLYTPKGWTPAQGRLPLLVWAYPQEFNDPATAGQVSGSPWRFTRVLGASHLFLVTQGWAVLDGAAMPIVGHPETMNDTFVPQIVEAARAAIDHVASLGVADPERVAVGGHSYGAFMTVNLLAHCDLFRAGVARSGAYNRSLTPFGFQGERRTLWEARETYAALSPFLFAERVQAPLLLVHGELDPNPGTFPLQSERLFHALSGHGKTARLVVLPFEGHGYQARESVLHVLAETIDWLDRHVKQAPPRAPTAGPGEAR